MNNPPSTNQSAPPAPTRHVALSFIGVLALAVLTRLLFDPGFYGSDDIIYSYRGAEIAAGIWRPAQNVGELRYGISIPISVFVQVFGPHAVAFSGWSLLCSIAEVALVFAFAYKVWGLRAAVLSAVIVGLTPIHVILGSLPLADSPLAFFFTLAIVSFFFAERSRNKWLYVLTGIATGFAWWVKPHAAVPFAAIFVLYAIFWRVWRREWIFVVAGGAGVVVLELALFWLKFGDPLYGIHLILGGISGQYIQSDSPWGSSAPSFYFRQMFLDGRDMWIVPYLAVAGMLFLARDWLRLAATNFGARYVLFWTVTLVCIFSFFIFSFNPVKFIPKETNYALIFFAPVALLAGYALSRMRGIWLAVTLSVFVFGAGALTALTSYGDKLHYSALKEAELFAREHRVAVVFVPQQVVRTAYLANLNSGIAAPPENLVPIKQLSLPRQAPQHSSSQVQYAIVDPSTPEMSQPDQAKEIAKTLSQQSWQKIAVLHPEVNGPGRVVVTFLSRIRPNLPRAIDRHLSFTDKLIAPTDVEIFCKGTGC